MKQSTKEALGLAVVGGGAILFAWNGWAWSAAGCGFSAAIWWEDWNAARIQELRLCSHGVDLFAAHCEPCAVEAETKRIGEVFDYPTFKRRNDA